MKKIDIHVHAQPKRLFKSTIDTELPTPEELIEIHDKIGIERAVLLPLSSPECSAGFTTNEQTLEMVLKYSDRFYWFCNIDPRLGNNPEVNFSYYLEYYKKLGAKGVGEIVASLYFDDPRAFNLFHHCEKCNMPVLFHIGGEKNEYGLIDDRKLLRLEKALQSFPDLIFIGHSARFWAEISGGDIETDASGYASGPVKKGGRVPELMRKYKNLHADISAGSGYTAMTRDSIFGYEFLEEFADRVYYGTDICDPKQISNPMIKLAEWLDHAVLNNEISQGTYEKVCRSNALRILEN